jgi:uncharacterized protein (TIGR00255 family)
MTGYAYREKSSLAESGQDLSISVEIKGCNSRFLEISVSLPPWLSTLEVKVREIIAGGIGRGKVDVFIRVREHNAPVKITVNTAAAKAYYEAISNLARELNLDTQCSINTLLNMESVFEIEKNRDDERYWNEMEPLLREAVKIFCNEREREGKSTEEDILKNLNIISASVKTVASFAPVIENNLKENIRSRFEELLGNKVDENRILAETASLLLKYTISEELSRLSSHLDEFKAENDRNQKPGKKLDFLCQEINREINTIGSKSAIIEVSGDVVKMKEALENIREQLRNIE